ncbi:MAG TPA: S-layer homology domain-containing protein [Thermoanaerobaculia bacterium]|nr:S-layer homology domain-containing protein [Thermoanaerobaculia bacterium]
MLAGSILGAQSVHPQTYGTTAVSYVEVPGIAFLPFSSGFTYGQGTGTLARYMLGCAGGCMLAPLRLPSGARIVSVELDGIDTDNFDSVEGSLFQCDRFGQNCTAHPASGLGGCGLGYICTGDSFNGGPAAVVADVSAENVVVDNTAGSLILLGSGDTTSELLGGMNIGYVLQVSEAPGFPTFNDVPVSDPAFQYIEALVASGVTAGCGGGNYCPDSPLTRRQMAVFLAKALGLQWP